MTPGRAHRLRLWATRLAVGVVGLLVLVVAAVWLFQRSLMYFPDPRPMPPDVDGPPIQVVRIETADHERLVGWFLPPRADQPVILQFNGNGGGLAVQRGRWRRIADHGAGFLAIGYRGYAGSTGHPTEPGLRLDARAAYGWLAARYPPERIVIHGYSLGSGVAVQLATEQPARALVLEAPYTSFADVARARFGASVPTALLRDRYASIDKIDRIHMPLLVVHGDRDSVIPYRLGRRLYDAASGPKRFVTLRGSDHNTLVRDGLYPHVWAFLESRPDPGGT